MCSFLLSDLQGKWLGWFWLNFAVGATLLSSSSHEKIGTRHVQSLLCGYYTRNPKTSRAFIWWCWILSVTSLIACAQNNLLLIFTALHVMQTRYSDENSVRLSVCLSVHPSHAWSLTKRKKDLSRFVYHTKEHLS